MLTLRSLLIVLLVHSLLALKRSEVGSNDWSIKTIGQFQDVTFLNRDRLAVMNNAGDLSYINKTSGEVLSRSNLGNPDSIFRKKGPGGFDEVYYFPETGALFKASLNDEQQKAVGKVSEDIINVFCQNSQCTVVTLTSVILLNGKELDETNSIQSKGKFISAFENNEKNIVVVEQLESKLCSRTLAVSSTISETNKQCIDTLKAEVFPFNRFTLLRKNHAVRVLDSVTLKQVQESEGNPYKLFPRSSTILLKTESGLRKLTPKNERISDFSMQGFIGETIKGNIFSIVKENGVFFLEPGYTERISWVSSSEDITSAWVNEINQMESQMVIQYSDLRVEYFVFESLGSKSKITPRWSREEALSSVESILFLDFQNEKELSNTYYQALLHHEPASFVSLYVMRLSFEIQALVDGIKTFISDIFTTITNINISHLLKGESSLLSQRSEADQKYFGMRKIVLASTSNGIIFAMDSKTSKVLWKSKLQPLVTTSPLQLFRMVANEVQKVIIAVHRESHNTIVLFELNWKNGEFNKQVDIPVEGQPIMFQVGESELGIKDSRRVHYYHLEQQESKHSFIFPSFNDTHITCQSIVHNNNLFDLWSMVIPEGETLVKTAISFRNDLQSKLPLFKDNVVYLKNVDYTNFAVLTKLKDSNVLNLYVLNGQNGHILLHKYKKNIDFNQEINLVYDENTILVSYFNTLNKMFEIWTIEQYKDKTYTSVSEIVSQYFNPEDTHSSHQKTRNNIMVFEAVFGSPLTIKNMYVSTSKLSLIRRNIYIISQKNQIYSLDRRLINTRRPSSESPIENEKYPPYDYLIPINPTHFITYTLNLDLNRVEFSPTALESTFLLLAVGQDIFMTRCSPDGTFDMITDSFNYPFLISVVILVTIILQFLKRRVRKARIAKPFLN